MKIEKMELYHQENPEIYKTFVQFTFQVISSRRKYFGSQAIIERIRWYHAVESISDDFKINNDMAAFYSRLFEKNYPEYKGFFRKRMSKLDFGE